MPSKTEFQFTTNYQSTLEQSVRARTLSRQVPHRPVSNLRTCEVYSQVASVLDAMERGETAPWHAAFRDALSDAQLRRGYEELELCKQLRALPVTAESSSRLIKQVRDKAAAYQKRCDSAYDREEQAHYKKLVGHCNVWAKSQEGKYSDAATITQQDVDFYETIANERAKIGAYQACSSLAIVEPGANKEEMQRRTTVLQSIREEEALTGCPDARQILDSGIETLRERQMLFDRNGASDVLVRSIGSTIQGIEAKDFYDYTEVDARVQQHLRELSLMSGAMLAEQPDIDISRSVPSALGAKFSQLIVSAAVMEAMELDGRSREEVASCLEKHRDIMRRQALTQLGASFTAPCETFITRGYAALEVYFRIKGVLAELRSGTPFASVQSDYESVVSDLAKDNRLPAETQAWLRVRVAAIWKDTGMMRERCAESRNSQQDKRPLLAG